MSCVGYNEVYTLCICRYYLNVPFLQDSEEVPVEVEVTNSVFKLFNYSIYNVVIDRVSQSFGLFSVLFQSYMNEGKLPITESAALVDELKSAGFKLDTLASVPNIARYLWGSIGMKVEIFSSRESDIGGLVDFFAGIDYDSTDFVIVSIKDIDTNDLPIFAFSKPEASTMFKVFNGVNNREFVKEKSRFRYLLLFAKKARPDIFRVCVFSALEAISDMGVLSDTDIAPPEFPMALYRRIQSVFTSNLNFPELDNEIAFLRDKIMLNSFEDLPGLIMYYAQIIGVEITFAETPTGSEYWMSPSRPKIGGQPSSVPGYAHLVALDNEKFLDGVDSREITGILVYEKQPSLASRVTWSVIQILTQCYWIREKTLVDQADELTFFNPVFNKIVQSGSYVVKGSRDLDMLTAQLEARGHKMNTFASIPEIIRERLVHFGISSEIPIISTSEASMQAKIANTPIKPSTEFVIVSVHSVATFKVPDLGDDCFALARADNEELVLDEPERRRAIYLFRRWGVPGQI